MRRYTFYLSIALLAFGIGSLVVFLIFVNGQNDLPVSEELKASQVEVVESFLENSKTKQAEFVEIAFKNLPCEDENLKPFWNELIDKTVSINTDYLERIKNCSDLIEADYLVGANNLLRSSRCNS